MGAPSGSRSSPTAGEPASAPQNGDGRGGCRYPARVTARPIALATLLLAGCAGPPPDPPTAVIDASPDELCEGDGFSTVIALSGARSSGRLSLVPAPPDPSAPPLVFRWDLTGAVHHVVSGSLDSRELEVVASGDRPLHVSLTTATIDGGEATSLLTIGVNVPIAAPCDDGCPAGTECGPYDGGMACLPSGTCAGDDECPPCFVCDAARCAPRGAP